MEHYDDEDDGGGGGGRPFGAGPPGMSFYRCLVQTLCTALACTTTSGCGGERTQP
jgi:hypothetical protein